MFAFVRWQQQFAIACFGWGFDPNSLLSLGTRDPIEHNVPLDPTSLRAKWHLNPSNGLNRVHKYNRRHRDRPRYGEMCSYRRYRIALQEVIPPNNTGSAHDVDSQVAQSRPRAERNCIGPPAHGKNTIQTKNLLMAQIPLDLSCTSLVCNGVCDTL